MRIVINLDVDHESMEDAGVEYTDTRLYEVGVSFEGEGGPEILRDGIGEHPDALAALVSAAMRDVLAEAFARYAGRAR